MSTQAKFLLGMVAVAAGAMFLASKRRTAAASAVPTNNVTKDIVPEWWTFAGQWNGSVS